MVSTAHQMPALQARLAMRLDSGLVSYPVIDPSLVADVSGNGTVSMLDAAMIAGIRSSSEGPVLASAPQPRQMLLRHGGSFRRADVIDVSGVLSDDQTSLLAASRDFSQHSSASLCRYCCRMGCKCSSKGKRVHFPSPKTVMNPVISFLQTRDSSR